MTTTDAAEFDGEALMFRAKSVWKNSYSPYSRFRVGAAVVASSESGELSVFDGVNVENASHGLTTCAERTAILKAVSSGCSRILAVAVACDAPDGTPIDHLTPCGACRQVMSEFMSPDGIVAIHGVGVLSLSDLLPIAFRLAPPKDGETSRHARGDEEADIRMVSDFLSALVD